MAFPRDFLSGCCVVSVRFAKHKLVRPFRDSFRSNEDSIGELSARNEIHIIAAVLYDGK